MRTSSRARGPCSSTAAQPEFSSLIPLFASAFHSLCLPKPVLDRLKADFGRYLAGVAAETGVVMLIYLDHALEEVRAECAAKGRDFTRLDLNRAIMLGAVERTRQSDY